MINSLAVHQAGVDSFWRVAGIAWAGDESDWGAAAAQSILADFPTWHFWWSNKLELRPGKDHQFIGKIMWDSPTIKNLTINTTGPFRSQNLWSLLGPLLGIVFYGWFASIVFSVRTFHWWHLLSGHIQCFCQVSESPTPWIVQNAIFFHQTWYSHIMKNHWFHWYSVFSIFFNIDIPAYSNQILPSGNFTQLWSYDGPWNVPLKDPISDIPTSPMDYNFLLMCPSGTLLWLLE